MVVFERDRPARREAELDAGADRATPTGFAGAVEGDPGEKAVVPVAGHSRAALHIAKHVVPGIADLTGEETDRIDPGLVDDGRERRGRARIRAVQVGPVALGFNAEHPV